MEELEALKEKFKNFVNKSFDELDVLVDEFDFDFSEPIYELYGEITKSNRLFDKFREIDFVLNVPLRKLGRIPHRPSIFIFPYTGMENVFTVYARYKLEGGLFVEDPEMTGYRAFEESTEDFLIWVKFWFEKRPYLPKHFVEKYELKGCIYDRNLYYPFEFFSCPCANFRFSFKNLNFLI